MATCVQNVRRALESNGEVGTSDRAWTGPSEEDPTYRLLVDCNQLAVDIDNEIAIVHNFMRDKYRCGRGWNAAACLHACARGDAHV